MQTEKIEVASTTLAAAVNSGDAAGAAALYADDARLLAPAGDLIAGRTEIEAYWQAGMTLGVSGIELEPLELECTPGAIVVEIGRYALSALDEDGESVIDRGKYFVLHRPQADGSWRCAVQIFNPDGRPLSRERRDRQQRSTGQFVPPFVP
jgi:uncharacterized protein (TIGR02246 family)